MPELPEVENVRMGLSELLPLGTSLTEIRCLRPDLRWPLPVSEMQRLVGQKLIGIERRAKYLLLVFESGVLLNHLGMTGSWRELENQRLHDHVVVKSDSGRVLVYNDPRRFGFFKAFANAHEMQKYLADLGPEPLDDKMLTPSYLRSAFSGRRQSVKSRIMDQSVVVGVGNIYASEALYLAGIKPTKRADRVTLEQCQNLVRAIRKVLRAAIAAGGSTIRDYRGTKGNAGSFQKKFKVYERAGETCGACRNLIRQIRISGRSTYYCPRCQS